MIASIQGVVQELAEDSLVLEVGGIGVRLEVPLPVIEAAPAIGKSFLLYTKLIVREDAVNLYGFLSREQRELFNTLVKIDGVGPRLAIAILSYLSPEVLQNAVANNQPDVLTIVPGVGRKTAEKMIFYLKDRLEITLVGISPSSEVDDEVVGILTTLGYSMFEAQSALKSIPSDAPEDVESRVRSALQYFSSK
jgi:Holliday junction DNA helicase RuvA